MTGPRTALPGRVLLPCALLFLSMTAAWGDDADTERRHRMIEKDIKGRGVADPAVLREMSKVPRHLFVDAALRDQAYDDHPLPIGEGQTISQPYVVALMTEALQVGPGDRVLEIGTGSGYQAAVLAGIVKEVYTIEIIKGLADRAGATLARLGYRNVHVRSGDGYGGWPEHAPFDAIIITAAADHIPRPLMDQLREGGRLIVPLGSPGRVQTLSLATKQRGALSVGKIIPVAFVPMTGEMQKRKDGTLLNK